MERVKFYDGVLLFTLEVASYISNGNVYLLINQVEISPNIDNEESQYRIKCYEILLKFYERLMKTDRDLTISLIKRSVNTKDRLYHYCLYQYLVDKHKDILITLQNSPYIADYLYKFDKQLLYNYYIQSKEFGKATEIMSELAYQVYIKFIIG